MAVFKKQLTPIGRRGRIVKQRGKGAVEQRVPRGEMDSVTGEPSFERAMGRYPKPILPPPEPEPVAAPTGPLLARQFGPAEEES